MPKITVNSRYHGDTPRVLNEKGEWVYDDPSRVTPEPFLTLGWDKAAEHVQIATLAGGDFDEKEHERPGLYVQLDRNGINRLIRGLRDARDAAFGKDA